MKNLGIFHFSKHSVYLVIAILFSYVSYTQEPNVIISGRVDIESSKNIKIIQIFKNYIKNPFQYPNDYWNSEEQIYLGQGFNLAFNMFQGINEIDFLKYFDFYILSLEQNEKDYYNLQILIQDKNGLNSGSSVWCILKIGVIKEKGKFVFQNNYINETKNWKRTKLDFIEYIYPHNYEFNLEEAIRANEFVRENLEIFKVKIEQPLKYFVCSDIDQLGLLQNFSYFFAGITTGVTKANKFIMSTQGLCHLHEIVHLILSPNENRNFILEEGLAEFYGTKYQDLDKYNYNQQELIKALKTENIPIKSLFIESVDINLNYSYALGSLICELIDKIKGNEVLLTLVQLDTNTNNKLLKEIVFLLDISEELFFEIFQDFVDKKN